ncbi:hypothetical protein IAT38_007559 [Cryptococcus sp. DSM 104549]
MPRLQILQHKSYHPYNEKNKQRVREDEAKARVEELAREQKRIDTEAEARLSLLRRRAGSPSEEGEEDNLPSTSTSRAPEAGGSSLLEQHKKKKAREEKQAKKKRDRLDFDFPSEQRSGGKGKGKGREEERERERRDEGELGWEVGGHVNLFADAERDQSSFKAPPTAAEIAKKKKDQEKDPFTMYLGRPERETNPWYMDKEMRRYEDKETGEEAEERRERQRRKDARSKDRNDPLTSINTLLASHPSSHHRPSNNAPRNPHPASADPHAARKAREMSERERARALLANSKKSGSGGGGGGGWDATPSTMAGGRSWEENWERQKAKAGTRFYDAGRR